MRDPQWHILKVRFSPMSFLEKVSLRTAKEAELQVREGRHQEPRPSALCDQARGQGDCDRKLHFEVSCS